MGKRGPAPKATALKKLAGNPGQRRLNNREPRPRISADMSINAIGAAAVSFRDRYKPILVDLKVLTDADVAAFELMGAHYSIAFEAMAICQKEGLLVRDKFMQQHKHPALQILRDNSSMFKSYAGSFGLTPSSRSQLQVPNPEDEKEAELERALFGDVRIIKPGEGDDEK